MVLVVTFWSSEVDLAENSEVNTQRVLGRDCRFVCIEANQYGVHIDPRTAYQRCHELQYEQFKSVQGLVDAMRDYQRIAPQKLTDTVLESILYGTKYL